MLRLFGDVADMQGRSPLHAVVCDVDAQDATGLHRGAAQAIRRFGQRTRRARRHGAASCFFRRTVARPACVEYWAEVAVQGRGSVDPKRRDVFLETGRGGPLTKSLLTCKTCRNFWPKSTQVFTSSNKNSRPRPDPPQIIKLRIFLQENNGFHFARGM